MSEDKRIGNQFWKARATHGRSKIFELPSKLEEACKEYFEHASCDYLVETKPHAYEGGITYSETKKMVPFTLGRLVLFLGIGEETWRDYRKREDFSGVCSWAERVIYEQKFACASAGLLSANIIARDLGLSDKKEVDLSSKEGDLTPWSGISTGDD